MKFAQDYKYRHIPFCSRCAAHTKFTPVQSNGIVGAMTFDNPNSNIDPTLVATRSETKLLCNACGSEMFKWSNNQVVQGKSFNRFLTKKELEKEKLEKIKGDKFQSGCVLFVTIPLLILLVRNLFWVELEKYQLSIWNISGQISIITIAILYTIGCMGSIFTPNKLTGGDLKRVENHNRVINVGKGVNGETILFHQETGEIEYKQ